MKPVLHAFTRAVARAASLRAQLPAERHLCYTDTEQGDESWREAYDLTVLAKVADFISVTTYSQHPRGFSAWVVGPENEQIWAVLAR